MSAPLGSCPFCQRIKAGDYVGYDRGCVGFEPLNPVTPGHMLFVPRAHVWSAAHAPWITARVFEVASVFAAASLDDFNLITSGGEAATQTVRHLHVHYVPRREGDGLALPWTGQVKS